MSLSPTAISAALAAETDEVFLLLLELDHPALAQPIRVVNDHADLVHGGETYVALAFDLTLPDDSDEKQIVKLTIDNVDRAIVDALRGIATPPTGTLKVVLASAPDVIEAGPFALTLRLGEYDALKVSADLTFEDILNEPFPAHSFTPDRYRGLF